MLCEICGRDPDGYYILPICKPDGSYITIACEKCAKASSAYCRTHDKIHMGFVGGFTLCKSCIDEAVEAAGEELGVALVAQIDLKVYPWAKLDEYAEFVTSFTHEAKNRVIGKAIIIAAMKAKVTPKKTIRQTVSMGDPYMLLPPPF